MPTIRSWTRTPARAAGLFLLAVALCLPGSDAVAHAKGPMVSPADGSALAEAPRELTLTFEEAVRLTSLRLYNAAGDEVELPGRRSLDPVRERRVPLPPLEAGQYRVEWRVLSADGHPVSGAFSFTIAPPP
ncbi:copper resistance CopC family protein [Pelagibius sp.]|uniref:copper resistance CopC family protein n=1 Tax=Pelagibius sp. TaxID=1931238 RepID=UPI003B5093ED